MNALTSLELFSGAGGLAKGLEQAGFEHSAFVEFNKHACLSLEANFDPSKVYFGDARDFDLNSINSIDVVAGGPPCQPFSLGGKHKSHDDNRDMFPCAIKAIQKLAPRAFVFENVKGLLRPTFNEYFEYILLRLSYPGFNAEDSNDWQQHLSQLRQVSKLPYAGVRYNVQYQLLNAADYGIPQTRERVFIVGIRADVPGTWTFPNPTHSEDRLLWDKHVSGVYWKKHGLKVSSVDVLENDPKEIAAQLERKYGFFEPSLLPWKTIRDTLGELPDPSHKHNITDHVYKAGARTYPGHTGSAYDWPSKTIKAGGHGVPGGENMIRFADGSIRYLTVFEAKKIQTFPDDFVVTGAWGEAMRQIGNAVPVELGRLIGNQLVGVLSQNKEMKQSFG
jgi:DNA (cytosine-5)-methyltransferase 1